MQSQMINVGVNHSSGSLYGPAVSINGRQMNQSSVHQPGQVHMNNGVTNFSQVALGGSDVMGTTSQGMPSSHGDNIVWMNSNSVPPGSITTPNGMLLENQA